MTGTSVSPLFYFVAQFGSVLTTPHRCLKWTVMQGIIHPFVMEMLVPCNHSYQHSCDDYPPFSRWPYQGYTVDEESFTRLNFRGFDPLKYFVEILSWFIGPGALMLIIKEALM